jgi:hypothetical protein
MSENVVLALAAVLAVMTAACLAAYTVGVVLH